MSKVNKNYYAKATQSIFLVAGILMVFTFPYFMKYFNSSGLILMLAIVITAILAGFAGKGRLVMKINAIVSVLGFALAAYRGVIIFFNGVEEPLAIFAFWTHQLLALVFFLAIYFSVRAMRS